MLRILVYWKHAPESPWVSDEENLVRNSLKAALGQPFTRVEALEVMERTRGNFLFEKEVERLAKGDIVAEGYVLYAYAAIEAWAAAVNAAGMIDFAAAAAALADGTFDTVLGTITFDDNGDVDLPAYVVYEWRDGEYDYAPM